MATILKFRPPSRTEFGAGLALAVLVGFAVAWFAPSLPAFAPSEPAASAALRTSHEDRFSAHFAICRSGARENCVIDGDTFYFQGEKIRIADIDAPETHPSRCASEDALGTRATEQLIALLNDGAFALEPGGDGRDTDVYGRKLRIVLRGGASIGETLIAHGLAHPWVGHKLPWC